MALERADAAALRRAAGATMDDTDQIRDDHIFPWPPDRPWVFVPGHVLFAAKLVVLLVAYVFLGADILDMASHEIAAGAGTITP
jgi:hypothetical protein